MTSASLPSAAQTRRGLALSTIAGIGIYRPSADAPMARRVSGSDLTGVSYRVQAQSGVTTASLAAGAARAALKAAGTDPTTLEMIVVGTTTPDVLWPSTACLVQTELKLPMVASFDLYAAETSLLTAVNVATHYVAAGARSVLVIGAESDNQLVDLSGQGAGVHGRAAAAIVLTAGTNDAGIVSTLVGGSARSELNGDTQDRILLRGLAAGVGECLKTARLSMSEIDLVIGEQSAPEIMQAWAKASGLPASRLLVQPARYGALLAAAPLIALHDAVRDGRLHSGMTALLIQCGSGQAWGAACVRWGSGGLVEW